MALKINKILGLNKASTLTNICTKKIRKCNFTNLRNSLENTCS